MRVNCMPPSLSLSLSLSLSRLVRAAAADAIVSFLEGTKQFLAPADDRCVSAIAPRLFVFLSIMPRLDTHTHTLSPSLSFNRSFFRSLSGPPASHEASPGGIAFTSFASSLGALVVSLHRHLSAAARGETDGQALIHHLKVFRLQR
jgi:hypothetical protein